MITGAKQFEERWLDIENKIIKYAQMEDKRRVKTLCREYTSNLQKTQSKYIYIHVIGLICNRSKNYIRSPNSFCFILSKRTKL